MVQRTSTVSAIAIMAFFASIRFATAFVPVSRSFATSSSSSVATTGGASKTLRRKRPIRSGDSAQALIEQLQREEGTHRTFGYGSFLEMASVASDPTSASESIGQGQLPAVFPLSGKNPLEQPPRMRFAPSPTGSLHVGGARTALYNWLVAKKGQQDQPSSNAAFVLRVEDTDVARSTRESEHSVLADLTWLGLTWDEGPDMPNAPYGPYRQSERGELYFAAAQRLMQDGKAYRCFCSPEELDEMKAAQEAAGETPRYDERWRDADPALVNKEMDKGTPYTVRFKVPDNSRIVIDDVVRGAVGWDAQATVGDFIMLRSSGIPVYNFCVAVDDASMGITTVVRAEEHLTNTLRQALILDALGAPRPSYAHCSLILGEDKQKLSKRHGATSCDQYRLDGFLPDAMINYLALLGWNDGTDNEIFMRDELIDAFELRRVVKSPSVFDVDKFKWVNSQHMKLMTVEELMPRVKDQLLWNDMLKDGVDMKDDVRVTDFAIAATALAKQMMETTKDAAVNAKEVINYGLPATFDELTNVDAKNMIVMGNFYQISLRIIEQYNAGIFPMPDPANPMAAFQDATGSAIEEDARKGAACVYSVDYMAHMKSMAKETGIKGRNLFHPLRLALSGEMSGQDVTKQMSLLSMACGDNAIIDAKKAGVVDFAERMKRLEAFCETIPEQFRAPPVKEEKGVGNKDNKDGKGTFNGTTNEKKGGITTPSSSLSGSGGADPMDSYEGPPISALDIRVGRITKVWEHPEADKLYCEEIDVGEDEPRQIASGLRPFMQSEDMEGRLVLVLCNLKARKLVGFASHGMVLCASNADHTDVKMVSVPVEAKVGERVTVPDMNFEGEEGAPYAENKIGKKKIFEGIAPFLVTSKYGVPEFLGRPFMTSAGVCTSPIPDGSVA